MVGCVATACVALTLLPGSYAGLIAHFKLDEGAIEPTTLSVASEVGGWTGELSSDTSFFPTWVTSGLGPVPGGTRAAVEFDSSEPGNDPRIATTCPGVTGDGARTVAAWIKGELPQPNFGVIVSWGRSASASRYTLRAETAAGANAGKLRLEVQGHAMVGEAIVLDGQWHHVAVVSPAGASAHTSTLYVDGVAQARTLFGTATTLNTTVDPEVPGELIHIGNGGWSLGAYGFKGLIDDVRIYDEALDAAQILALAAGAGTAPTFTQPLTDQRIVLGDPAARATFTAGASGSPPLVYEWQFNGNPIPGQTGATLEINPAGPADAGTYTVKVSNAAGSVSSSARLILSTAPVELNQQVGLVGGSASFAINMPAVSGYTYQWRLGESDLAGQTSSRLTLENLQPANAGQYSVRVTLGAHSAVSEPATLRVLPVPASAYAAAVLRDGPAAYWRLGEVAGAEKAADATTFHDGNYIGLTGAELGQAGALAGDADTALLLSAGGLAFVELAQPSELNDVRAFTVEAWVRPNYLGNFALVDASFNLPSRGYRLELTAGGTFRFRTGASLSPANEGWDDLAGGQAEAEQWYHVVGTFDGATKHLFVNGLEVGEQAAAVSPSLGLYLRLGAGNGSQANPGRILDGTLDEVAYYRRALPGTAVAAHYRASGRVAEGVLGVERTGNGIRLTWEGEGWVLEASDLVTEGWSPIPNATSPYTVSTAGTTRFFRLVRP
jgi:hypothetical protein